MTPEERQLLTKLADRVKSTPAQQKDAEADQLLHDLCGQRPDTVYILAQTVLIQDFALRNAQAQIEDLQRQQSQTPSPERGSGSFLGGLLGSGTAVPPRSSGSVPNVNPWAQPHQGGPSGDYQPQGPAMDYPQAGPSGTVLQPSQTSSFLRSAATTAAGVAGGAFLFQGINSLFSGHTGLFGGGLGGFGGLTPRDNLSETTVVNNYYDDPKADRPQDAAWHGDDGGVSDADYTDDDDYGDDEDPGDSEIV